MNVNIDEEIWQKPDRFSRLGAWYILALTVIAVIAITGQVLIQVHLRDQLSDSAVVNVAGKQRMLSQKIAKLALVITSQHDKTVTDSLANELAKTAELWSTSQNDLVRSSEEVRGLFEQITPSFQAILHHTNQLLDEARSGTIDSSHLQIILQQEREFLSIMDKIVEQYANEAQAKVTALSTLEYVLIGITLFVIFLEVVYIFRPTTAAVAHTIEKLISSENNARQLTREIGALYTSLERSYEQVAIVNQPVDNPVLFAKSDKLGRLTFRSGNMERLFAVNYDKEPYFIYDLFPSLKEPVAWLDDLLTRLSERTSWDGEVSFVDGQGDERWARVSITPVHTDSGVEELVMTGSDITSHKNAKRRIDTRNRAEIERTINQQKFRSVLILEGQEEERKRIAMDIHDGIGQMLTSLKFQIESIDLSDRVKTEGKIREIDQLIKEVIREVRRVTFNIKPTVLGDYGLQAALNVFITEMGKLTDIDLVYDTAGKVDRLPQKVEDNIFRIIQEAVNNAAKYSGAAVIEISLHQKDHVVILKVKDQGKGFNTNILKGRNTNIESGRGFFNMYERTGYINGKLDIHSVPGEGTTVTLEVPLQNAPVTTSEEQ